MKFSTVILAAGKGTRMKSDLPKVVHKIAGKPILQHVIHAVRAAGSEQVILVLGFGKEQVLQNLPEKQDLQIATQEQQLGTGHALMQAEALLPEHGTILVTNGDTPLLQAQTLAQLLKTHWASGAEATVMTAKLENSFGYGRVIRTQGGFFDRIVEEKDASNEEKKITEVNSGTYCFQVDTVCKALHELKNDNAQHEYYLPDVLKILRQWRLPIAVFSAENSQDEIKGINDHVQQAEAEKILHQHKNNQLMLNGVTIVDPSSTYIDWEVVVEHDTTILPGTFLNGNCYIGKNCIIGPYANITDSTIGEGCTVQQAWLKQVQLHDGCQVGPFAYLRNQTILETQAHVGSFAEIKNSQLGSGSAVPHFSYVGDSHIGEKVNLGAGCVTCNFNGQQKNETQIEDGAFVGSNTTLIAPVHIGKEAYLAAGSVITEDVPEKALAIERTSLCIKPQKK